MCLGHDSPTWEPQGPGRPCPRAARADGALLQVPLTLSDDSVAWGRAPSKTFSDTEALDKEKTKNTRAKRPAQKQTPERPPARPQIKKSVFTVQIGPACPKCRRALGTTITLRDDHKCVNLGRETVNNDSFAHSNGLVPVPECYVQDLHMGISNGPAGPVNPVAARRKRRV